MLYDASSPPVVLSFALGGDSSRHTRSRGRPKSMPSGWHRAHASAASVQPDSSNRLMVAETCFLVGSYTSSDFAIVSDVDEPGWVNCDSAWDVNCPMPSPLLPSSEHDASWSNSWNDGCARRYVMWPFARSRRSRRVLPVRRLLAVGTPLRTRPPPGRRWLLSPVREYFSVPCI